MAEQTLGDRDERLAANFDGTEFTECFPTSQGVSFRSKLGTAASRDVTESATDTTKDRLLKVGDGGWLSNSIILNGSNDLNDYAGPAATSSTQILGHTTGSPAQNSADGRQSVILNLVRSITGFASTAQLAINTANGNDNKIFFRGTNSDDNYRFQDSWRELYHTGNIKSFTDPEIKEKIQNFAVANWQKVDVQAAAAGGQFFCVTHGDGKFVALNTSGDALISTNGVVWLPSSLPLNADNPWRSITHGDGLFVAVANSGAERIITSPDGLNWTLLAAPAVGAWQSVTYGDGLFVAVATTGARVMTSPDGANWTERSGIESNSWQSVTYGNGIFVAVAESGDDRVMTSPDGENWTARMAAEQVLWKSVTYGNGLFVAVGYLGVNSWIMTSPDGENWTSITPPVSAAWQSVTYGDGLFVAVGSGGMSQVMTSRDGEEWKGRAAAGIDSWNDVAYGDGLYVAVRPNTTGSEDHKIMRSLNYNELL